jgi:phytoene synthase
MQLTNILRDVGEDLAAGRVYLPDEDLAAFGCDLSRQPAPDALAGLIRFEASRAHGWFQVGRRLLPLLDRPSAACVATIAGTYEQLLRRIERQPEAVVHERVRVPVWSKAWILTRAVVGPRT